MQRLSPLLHIQKCNPEVLSTTKLTCRNYNQKRFILAHMGLGNRIKKYHGRQLVGYSMEQMYMVVADVENFRNFLPFCKKSIIVHESKDYTEAALQIGFSPIVESYVSRIIYHRPYYIKSVCVEGKLFNHLINQWRFNPGLKSNPNSCIVDCQVSFEFKSALHSNLAHIFFETVVKQMEGAFLKEAKRRYGKETLPSHPLAIKL